VIEFHEIDKCYHVTFGKKSAFDYLQQIQRQDLIVNRKVR
jgi:hypothetical protein